MLDGRKKKTGHGTPSWLATYSDLMNLLLCFFVMLYAMSNIDAQKYEEIRSSFGRIGFVGNGILSGQEGVLNDGDDILKGQNVEVVSDTEAEEKKQVPDVSDVQQQRAEELYNGLTKELMMAGIGDGEYELQTDQNFNYISITVEGAVLFASGDTKLKEESLPFMSKIGDVLKKYPEHMIEVVGHTDNRQVSAGADYLDNNELSTKRALSAFYYFTNEKEIDPSHMKFSGRGEYEPVADNETPEGRQQNRRIEIRIYMDE